MLRKRKNKRVTKVLAVASEGGHWVQLMRLKPAFDKYSTTYVSTNPGLKDAYGCDEFKLVRDANLNKKLSLILSALEIFFLVLRERPTHVISTGAAPGFLSIVWGKIFGAKTIWIDSIANAEELSAAGKRVKWFADHWLTQWPELSGDAGPIYKGRVL